MTIITKFSTTNNEEDILNNVNIQKRICERLSIKEEDYGDFVANKGIKMDCTIFFPSINSVSINNGLYNDLIEDSVFTLGEFSNIKSIKIKTATNATIMIDLD